jgi:nitrate reductase gamma subunit
MNVLTVTRIIALVGLLLGLAGILARIRTIMNRPFKDDLSRPQGSANRGLLYAFTLGMAPWEKESTRKHWASYFRGIFFHIGIFAAFGVLLASPWLEALPEAVSWVGLVLTGFGAVFGFAGIFMRLAGENERVLSLPDDYFSVFLSSLFIALACTALLLPGWLPIFYLVAALLCSYVPYGKIRHCVYFFFSKFFFGRGFGHRAVIGQAKSKFAE